MLQVSPCAEVGSGPPGNPTESGGRDPGVRQLDEQDTGDRQETEGDVGVEEKREHHWAFLHITNVRRPRFHVRTGRRSQTHWTISRPERTPCGPMVRMT